MPRFRKVLRMSSRERRLLLAGGVVVASVRVLLWTLPFSRLLRLVEQTALRSARVAPVRLPEDTNVTLLWGVTTAARYVPGATCLTQALAAQWLFAWFGHPTQLRIGVAKANGKLLRAHAWLESDGRVVVGGESLEQDEYAVLSPPASGAVPNQMPTQ
jgi:transglutaminase superfamily protein